MSAGRLARFYRAAGYRVVESDSATWFAASRRVWQSLPGVRPVDPAAAELRSLLRRHRLAGLQFATGSGPGAPTVEYVVRDAGYDLPSLDRTFRQNLAKGREACEVREIGFDELARIGLPVNRDALSRRGYRDPRFLDLARWHVVCAAGDSSEGAGALGSFHQGRLASYLIHLVDETGVCHGLHMFSRREAWPQRPNHVLYYEFTRRMIARPEVRCVSTGLRPVPPAGDMDRFKRQAGYRCEIRRLAVVLHPAVEAALLSRPAAALLAAGRRLLPDQPALARVEAVADAARATRTPR